MAHTGKHYLLHFRRDLSLQCQDNKIGWAAQYRPIFGDNIGTVANAAPAKTWRLFPLFDPGTAHMHCQTAPQVVAGKNIFLEFTGDQGGNPKIYQCLWTWRQVGVGILFQMKMESSTAGQFFSIGSDARSDVTIQTAGVWEWHPGFPAEGNGVGAIFW